MTDVFARLQDALSDRYTIERELGQGGMATVYLARDLKHDRVVALKVLRPELSAVLGADRFLREIRTTAQLTHPHILPLLDSGGTGAQTHGRTDAHTHGGTGEFLYYVMPYVEGESLRDRLAREKQLPLDDALQVAREVADGLAYAHSHGVVHRDIKPENILLQSGHAVLADFGIARAVGAAGSERLTETGLAIGTPAYMSPEQAAGESDLDGRSDLYSLGCVLYEMLAGEPPFTGPSVQAVVAKRLSTPAPRISILRDTVPAAVEAALAQALARTPADRFATASQFAEALRERDAQTHRRTDAPAHRRTGAPWSPPAWWRRRAVRLAVAAAVFVVVAAAIAVARWARPGASGARHPRTAVAILPLENLSPEGPHAYFAVALHDELLVQLGRVAALSVRPRTSVLAYAHTTKPLRVIGEELGVGTIVEGSVQVEGDRLRVNVQIIDPMTEAPLWASSYSRTLDDAFAVQSEIAQRIVEVVGGALTQAEAGALAEAPTRNAEAYRLYLQGEEQRVRTCCDSKVFESAQRLYERAIELDSGFALAHASLSRVHGLMQVNGWDPRPERVASQRAEAETALRLAPRSPQARLAMGMVYFLAPLSTLGDMRQALREYQLAAEEAPGSAEVWDALSGAYFCLGDWDAYQAAFDRAAALDPRSASRSVGAAGNLWMRHRYEAAAAAFDEWLALARPEDLAGRIGDRALLYVVWQGKLDTLRALVKQQDCQANRDCVQLALWERKPDSLLALLPEPQRVIYRGYEIYEPALLYVGWAQQLRGDSGAARRAFSGALAQLDSALRELPRDPGIHGARGLALAGLGRRAEAKREADWLLAPVDSIETDYAQYFRTSAALILAQAGFHDEALPLIERLLPGPSMLVSGPMLRLDPRWDPIRRDPRFQALVRRYGG